MQEKEGGKEGMMQVQLKSKTIIKNFENIKKIVVLSDTHIPVRAAKLPDKVLEEIKDADLVLHAGDFQTVEVVQELEKLGKLAAVHGNMDSDDVAEKLPEKVIVEIKNGDKEFKIGIVHGYGAPDGMGQRVLEMFEEKLDCIVFGHSHQPFNEKINNTLMFNPGSPTDTVFATINTFGILKLDVGIKGDIVKII